MTPSQISRLQTFYGLHSVRRKSLSRNINRLVLVLVFHVTNDLEIG
jgi:hypothetical protein